MFTAEFHVHDDVLEVFAPELMQRDDVEEMFRRLAELRLLHARPFLLVRNGGPTMSTEARQAITRWFRAASGPIECATYGGGMVQRVVVEMLRRAVDLLTPGKMVLGSCKTRDEALAWIDERRRRPAPAR
jgi:hypothetical protein